MSASNKLLFKCAACLPTVAICHAALWLIDPVPAVYTYILGLVTGLFVALVTAYLVCRAYESKGAQP